MRLYVPEIGDRFRLTADWTFALHNEGRNSDLWSALDCDRHPSVAVYEAKYRALIEERDALIERGETVSHSYYGNPTVTRKRVALADQARYDEIQKEFYQRKPAIVEITLPAGTELTVDRVYIRKGAGDYSSLSFYIADTPLMALKPAGKGGFKKGRRRFWAKLADVNRIECEVIEEKALPDLHRAHDLAIMQV